MASPSISISDWRTIYQTLSCTSANVLYNTPNDMGAACRDVGAFYAAAERYRSTSTPEARHEMLRAVIAIAKQIPVCVTATNMRMMERRFFDTAAHYDVVGYSVFGELRSRLMSRGTPVLFARQLDPAAVAGAGSPQNSPREVALSDPVLVWSTVLAHIMLAGEAADTTQKQTDIAWGCAKYTGDSFTTFSYMLLTLQLVTGFLPDRTVACLATYVQEIETRCNGAVPKDFICH